MKPANTRGLPLARSEIDPDPVRCAHDIAVAFAHGDGGFVLVDHLGLRQVVGVLR